MTLPFSDASGITTSCTVSENLRENNMGSFCGDSESLLDRMIEQCQTRPAGRHPGFGRKLVPYFGEATTATAMTVTTTTETQLDKNTKPRGDGCYARGTGKGGGGGGNKRSSPRSSRRGGAGCRSYPQQQSPPQQNSSIHATEDMRSRRSRPRERPLGGNAMASVTLLSKKDDGGEVEYAFQKASVCSLFAGPICFNSPPPEALPMPTAVLLAKAMCLS